MEEKAKAPNGAETENKNGQAAVPAGGQMPAGQQGKQAQPAERKEPTVEELKKAYGDLNKRFSELFTQYQKLSRMYNDAMSQIKGFDYLSFFLSMLFKVMEHPNRYPEGFIVWCSKHIQRLLTTFESELREVPDEEQERKERKKDVVAQAPKDEAKDEGKNDSK